MTADEERCLICRACSGPDQVFGAEPVALRSTLRTSSDFPQQLSGIADVSLIEFRRHGGGIRKVRAEMFREAIASCAVCYARSLQLQDYTFNPGLLRLHGVHQALQNGVYA